MATLKLSKTNDSSKGMNPHKERREVGQKSPKSNVGMIRKSMPRGR